MRAPRLCLALALSGIAPALRGGAMSMALAGCTYGEASELSAVECSDSEDNDGDDLMNCEDPDCQAHAHCAAFAAHPIRDPNRPPASRQARAPEPLDTDAAEPTEPEPDLDPDEDAGRSEPTPSDAGAAPCDGRCDPSECVDDVCSDPRAPTGGAFELHILAVEVPDFDRSGMCLDACVDSLLPPFGICACAPDPYVEVWRERGEGEQRGEMLVGSTSVASNDRSPNFRDDPIPIELLPGDGLEFVLKDDDPGAGPNSPVYACRPNLSALEIGPLACSARVFSFLPPYGINAELRPLP